MTIRQFARRVVGAEARERKASRQARRTVETTASPYHASEAELAALDGQAIAFRSLVKHQGHALPAAVPMAFGDPQARGFFIAAGWADAVEGPPKQFWPHDVLNVDPSTVSAATGRLIVGG